MAGEYYFDCYCPFGARSMPSVFQRLTDAIRVIMLRETPVGSLLGMSDDFLVITYRKDEESDEDLLERGHSSAKAFGDELLKMGMTNKARKTQPPLGNQFGWGSSSILRNQLWQYHRRRKKQSF